MMFRRVAIGPIAYVSAVALIGCGVPKSQLAEPVKGRYLYRMMRDYIANDTMAARICGVPRPLPVHVWGKIVCPLVGWNDLPDISSFLYPTRRSDSVEYRDSLASRREQPCDEYDVPELSAVLSTDTGQSRTIVFWAIDSTFASGYRVASATIYDKFRVYDNSALEEGDSSYSVDGERAALYIFVYDRSDSLIWARGWADPFQH